MSSKTNLMAYLSISVLLLATPCPSAVGKAIYVDADATGVNDGSSWGDAYNHLQDTLTDANVVDSRSMDIVDVPTANRIAGELTQDTTWSRAYILEDTVVVPTGRVLNIEPGTVVLMKDAAARMTRIIPEMQQRILEIVSFSQSDRGCIRDIPTF